MNQFTKEQVAANKANPLNEMNIYVNVLIPKLNAYLATNEIKTKVDGSLFAKNADAIRAIIAEGKPANVRCHFRVANYEGCKHSIEFDTNYKTGDYGCAYIKGWMQLQDVDCSGELPTTYTAEKLIQIENRIAELEKQQREIQGQISRAKNEAYLQFKQRRVNWR